MGRGNKKSKEASRPEASWPEKYLEHGSIVLNTITRRINVQNTIYSWRVFDYPNLKPDVVYFQEFDRGDLKCVLKLLKSKSTLYLCLRCNKLVNKMSQFYVESEIQPTHLSVKAVKICDGLYTGEFKRELFEGSELPYLVNGMLTISFRYVYNHETNDKESSFEGADILSDLDRLCCDLKHMYLGSMHPDFEITIKDYAFKTHKFCLSARSKFFNKYFDENLGARCWQSTVDVSPGILHEVLLYVYSGKLKDMDFDCMMQVWDLADNLQMSYLVEYCETYFNSRIDETNYNEFRTQAMERQNARLNALVEKIGTKIDACLSIKYLYLASERRKMKKEEKC